MTVTEAPPEPDWLAAERQEADAYAPRNGQPTQRTPPHNLDAEASLLGACLLSTQAIDDALDAGLRTEDFYKPAHAHVFDAVTTLYAQGKAHDPVTVAEELDRNGTLADVGGHGALVDLESSTPASTNAAHYARIVVERARMRTLIGIGSDVAQLGWGMPDDVAAAEDTARTLVARVAERRDAGTDRLVDGGSWLFDQPANPPAVWGRDQEVLWAEGEGFILVGPPGVGKTTLAAQILEGRLGVGPGELLGWPVQPTDGRVLYIAADRPSQIARAARRTFDPADRDVIDERLVVHRGPLGRDLGVHPEALIEMVRRVGAATVFIDSLKDLAVKLSDSEAGGNVNRALQICNAEGVDFVVLHHHRKGETGGAGKEPRSLEELFGSALFAAGAGSVVQLWGAAGDLIVKLRHLKQPMEEIGPLEVAHDHHAGRTTISRGFDLIAYLRHHPGATTVEVGRALFEPAGDLKENERRKAARRLESAERRGTVCSRGGEKGGAGGSSAIRWYLVDRDHSDDEGDF